MRTTSRRKAIAFFITLGSCLVGIAVSLNVSWIYLNWRAWAPMVLGIIFFGVIIAGITLNTIFLVREIRRNEQHDSFINAVTHELKTPITSIRLYLETLQKRDVEESQKREFYRVMLADTDRLLSTVEQVLKAGELGQKGRGILIPVDLTSLVEESLELARTRHNLPNGSLRLACTADVPPVVMGDPAELRTAISNVLDNAIKYSGDEVFVGVEVAPADKGRVEVRVVDRGVGIPPAEVKRIFKRFYRVHDPAIAHIKGTGLGLFLVRAIARKHHGDAFAHSSGEGRGSTVVIQLPRLQGSAQGPAAK